MFNEDKYIDNQAMHIINQEAISKGNLLYYSENQVATLLGESISKIKYYTNIFDNILQVEVVNKELRYTKQNIDTLSFLIKLKNQGMTFKEIELYYSELPLNEEGSVEFEENNFISVTDLMNSMLEKQNEQLTHFKEDLIKEIKYYIDTKLDDNSKKIDERNSKLIKSLDSKIAEFNKNALDRDNNLLKYIRDFKYTITQGYHIQREVELEKYNNRTFFYKFFRKFINQ